MPADMGRATCIARCVASVPEMVNRTSSAARDQLRDQLGRANLQLVAGAEVRAARHLILHRPDDRRVAVAEEEMRIESG
jgi:hypothetical protein